MGKQNDKPKPDEKLNPAFSEALQALLPFIPLEPPTLEEFRELDEGLEQDWEEIASYDEKTLNERVIALASKVGLRLMELFPNTRLFMAKEFRIILEHDEMIADLTWWCYKRLTLGMEDSIYVKVLFMHQCLNGEIPQFGKGGAS